MPSSSIILYITNIVKHWLHVWHPVVCFSGRRRVAARTCLPVDSPRETAAAVPPATGGTRHGHSCGGHCPGSLQHSRQPPGTEINIYSPHPCYQGNHLNSIKGAVMRFWESIFIFSNCQLQQKLKLSISLSGPNTGSGAAPGSSFGKFKCRI